MTKYKIIRFYKYLISFIWVKPGGIKYYPTFIKDFWYLYPGSYMSSSWRNRLRIEEGLSLLTEKDSIKFHKEYYKKDRVSRLEFIIDGIKLSKIIQLCQRKKN